MINKNLRSVVFLAGGVVSLALLAGCGGGGGGGGGGSRSTTGTPTPVAATRGVVRLRLSWSSIPTRALPGAAQSVRVTLMRNGQAVDSRLVTRDPNQNSAYDDSVVFTNLDIADFQVVVSAYASTDATGVVLTQGNIDFPLSASQPERVAEITPGKTVTSSVDHLSINASRIAVGQNVTLTASAFSASNEAVPVSSLRWSCESGKGATITDGGTLRALQATTVNVTVTDPDSGKSATQAIQCGYGTQISIATSGAAGAVPFVVSPFDDDTTDQTLLDDSMQSLRSTDSDGNAVSFQWVTSASVAQNGAPITIKAPATYGDRQFVKWQQGGQDGSTSATATLDPKTMTQPNLVAVYAPRSMGADGYLPNHLHDHDLVNNGADDQNIFWKTSRNKVTFLTSGQYSDDAKNRAIQGFQLWAKAVGGRFGYDIIGNDQPDQADIIVAFSDRTMTPAPSTYVPGYTTTSVNSSYAGLTVYNYVKDDSGALYGTGKRVIYLFGTGSTLMQVAAHEMGHASGFVGHSEQKNDLMYPTVYVRSLSERDVNAFLTIKTQADSDTNTRALHGTTGPLHSVAIP